MKKLILAVCFCTMSFFFSQKNENYIQISYSGICCGMPSAVPVMNYISQFQKKNRTGTLEILQQTGLGKEGEFNLYISTDQLSESLKTKFVSGLQAAVAHQNKSRNKNRDGSV